MTDTAKITVYGAEWCAFCHTAMQYFDKLGVAYTYKQVDIDMQSAKEAVEKSGQTGIPVLDIDGEIVVGFDRPHIDKALAAKHIATNKPETKN